MKQVEVAVKRFDQSSFRLSITMIGLTVAVLVATIAMLLKH